MQILFFPLGLIGVTLLALFFLPEGAIPFDLEKDDFAQIASLSILGLAIASGLTMRKINLGEAMRNIALWVLAFAVLIVGYTLRDDFLPVWQRVQAALLPGHAVTLTPGSVEIARSASGDFQVRANVNEAPVSFIFDTGASAVVLTSEDAERAGFSTNRLSFRITVNTANGQTQAAPITIGEVRIGSITRENVRGLVAQPGDLTTSLLGMTFLDQLNGFSVEGNRLLLRD